VTPFDYAVIATVVLSGLFAFSRGLVREALSIVAWVLATVAAFYASEYLPPLLRQILPAGPVGTIVTGGAAFLVALIVLHMIARGLAGHVKRSALSPVDRTLGLVFGVARGLLLACLAYLLLNAGLPSGNERPRWFAESRTAPYLGVLASRAESYFPRFSRPTAPGRGSSVNVETEVDKAINALATPARAPERAAAPSPVYTPDEQRDLNRLIEQQNSQ